MPIIVKNTTFPNLLDLLAPHSCRGCGRIGEPLCNRCKNNIILDHDNYSLKIPKSFPPTFVVGDRTGLIWTLIHDLKYHSVRALAKPLAKLLDETLPPIKGAVIIVPLPTISRHIRSRGLDHTYLIAKYFAKLRSYPIAKLLIRNQNTVQVGTNRTTRLAQARTAYSINPKIKINPNITYILLDDVWTTGASMKTAVKKLQHAGAKKIIVAILAISDVNQN